MRLVRSLVTTAMAAVLAGTVMSGTAAAATPDPLDYYKGSQYSPSAGVTSGDLLSSRVGGQVLTDPNSPYNSPIRVSQETKSVGSANVTKTVRLQRQENYTVLDYGWILVGDGYPVAGAGRHDTYFHSYLWAGNNTTSNGYGAHDSVQPDGRTTHWYRDNVCGGGHSVYTPSYNGGGAYQAGFYDASPNPYRYPSDLRARGGIIGGDPLMRWSGHSGYGWYYTCYAVRSYNWGVTGSHTETRTVYLDVNVNNLSLQEVDSSAGNVKAWTDTSSVRCVVRPSNTANSASATLRSLADTKANRTADLTTLNNVLNKYTSANLASWNASYQANPSFRPPAQTVSSVLTEAITLKDGTVIAKGTTISAAVDQMIASWKNPVTKINIGSPSDSTQANGYTLWIQTQKAPVLTSKDLSTNKACMELALDKTDGSTPIGDGYVVRPS